VRALEAAIEAAGPRERQVLQRRARLLGQAEPEEARSTG
jgi:hypothetical protein